MQRHQDAAVRQGDIEGVVAGLFGGDFLIAGAADVGVALGVQHPAVGLEDLHGLGGIIGVGVQLGSEHLLGVLVHPHAQAVGAVDNGAVTLAELVGKLVAVEQVGDGMAHSLKLRGAEVALEGDLAVAVALEGGHAVAALFHEVQGSVDLVAVGQLVQHVDGAGLEGVKLGLLHGLDHDDLLDGRLLALEVAGVVGVDLHNGLGSAGVVAHHLVGAGGDAAFIDPAGGVQLGSNQGAAVQVHALAVVLDGQLGGSVLGQVQGAQGSVAQIIVVGHIVRADGDGVGVLVQQPQAGDVVGRAGLIVGSAHHDVGGDLRAGLQGGGGEGNQIIGHIVGGGDGLAVIVNQALVDLHGEGLGAVLVHHGVDARGGGGVHHESAVLVVGDGGVVVDEIAQRLIVGVVGPPGVAQVTGQAGGGAVDHAVGTGFRRIRVVGGSVSGGVISGVGGVGGGVGGGVLACVIGLGTASEQTKHHHHCQQKRQQFGHLGIHFFPPKEFLYFTAKYRKISRFLALSGNGLHLELLAAGEDLGASGGSLCPSYLRYPMVRSQSAPTEAPSFI